MGIDNLKSQIQDFAKDIRLNLSTVLTEEGSNDLTSNQINGITLSCAYCLGNINIINELLSEEGFASPELNNAAKSAAAIMAMNNIYYRFNHLVDDKDFSKLPAKLRMNVIANPGISKIDFELMCLAISAINGCGMCMDSHTKHLLEAGISKVGIQSCIRIASVFNAVDTALNIG